MARASISAACAEAHGPLRLAILPIGAYEPRWFMQDQHMNPADAVKALADCGAAQALAHHHGTFQLTDEAIDAPAQALHAALEAGADSRASDSPRSSRGRSFEELVPMRVAGAICDYAAP